MRSDRPRRPGVKARRSAKRLKTRAEEQLIQAKRVAAERIKRLKGQVLVNPSLLRSTNSYDIPDFVQREFYVDRLFRCKDCGKSEVWSASRQKWWYEIAKGDVWTIATRCRPCRRLERERKASARRTHQEGLARKRLRGTQQ
jgi:Probable zinc-ribbon domain